MQRQHPMLSATGLAMTVLVLVVLGAVYGRTGGRMFSPGPLAPAHAEIEDCAACHRPLETSQAVLCMECHTEIETEMNTGAGLHAALPTPDQCRACHPDHRGSAALVDFDHANTRFPLTGLHLEVDCSECHTPDSLVSGIAGEGSGLAIECAACHAEPALHAGLFPPTCEDCHTSAGWSPALLDGAAFDHFAETGFSLDKHQVGFAGEVLDCRSCHVESLQVFEPAVCEQCHTSGDPVFMAAHAAGFGTACLDCHDGVDSMVGFDHSTVFVLDGSHAELACASCHISTAPDGTVVHTFAGTPAECAGCHAEPDIHAGLFGVDCASCHNTFAWRPAALTNHSFPLDHGGEGEMACSVCHTGATFLEYTCDRCHAPAEMVEEHNKEDIFDIAGRCVDCHPTGARGEAED